MKRRQTVIRLKERVGAPTAMVPINGENFLFHPVLPSQLAGIAWFTGERSKEAA